MARLRRNHMAVIGMVIIAIIVLSCAIGPLVIPFDPEGDPGLFGHLDRPGLHDRASVRHGRSRA
ncbi:MAG: hypothetical protein WDN69_37195 [Aliidongia sp.]